jgi:hypothetical protein
MKNRKLRKEKRKEKNRKLRKEKEVKYHKILFLKRFHWMSFQLFKEQPWLSGRVQPGNTKGRSITVLLTSYLTGLD